MEIFFLVRDYKFDSGLCNCFVDVVWSFRLLCSLTGVLRRAIKFETRFFSGFQGEKWRSSARYPADNVEVSLIPLYIVKDHSRHPTEIPLLISYHSDFQNCKRQNARTRSWLYFPLHDCGVAPNVPKCSSKIWSFIVKTLAFDWPAEHVFATRVDR